MNSRNGKKSMVIVGVLLLMSLAPATQVAFADVGPGVLSDVQYQDGTGVPKVYGGEEQTFFIVVPGDWYKVVITNVEYTGTVDVWIKGKNQDGSNWVIHLSGQNVIDGTVTTVSFQIPQTAGCTIQVAYGEKGHETKNPTGPGTGHMKTFYDDKEPFDNPVPCEGVGVPDFPIGPELITATGLLAVYALRRKQRR